MTKLFRTLDAFHFKVAADKVFLGLTTMPFLGYTLTAGNITPDAERVRAIADLRPPKTKTEVKAFLGLVGYYRQFIKGFAKLAKPLTILLSDSMAWTWGPAQ